MRAADFLELVAGPRSLFTVAGEEIALPTPTLAGAVAYAHGLHRRAVLWVHESAADAWGLPGEPRDLERVLEIPPDARSSDGWLRLSREVHLAIPRYSGDFEGTATPADLARALELFRAQVGDTFLFSAPATALHMIGARFTGGRRPSAPSAVPFAPSSYAIPAHTWSRTVTTGEREHPFVQLFDRRGSYLAAWRSCGLPDGDWSRLGPFTWSGADWAPGYYLAELERVRAYVAALGRHDPFDRAPSETPLERGTWITEPLAVLAGELAVEAGIGQLEILRAVVAPRRVRPLDYVSVRLVDARVALEASTDPLAGMVLELVKDAYTRGTAHLEYGRRPPHPLHRPEWRHTIIDRHVANTWRALRRTAQLPLVVGGVDAAIFAVASPGDVPAGLNVGPDFGAWRARATMPMGDAAARLEVEHRGHGRLSSRELLFELMEAA